MNPGKILLILAAAAVLIALAGLAVKLIAGFFGLVGSLFNALLGLAILLGLAVLVIWMFRTAAKNRK